MVDKQFYESSDDPFASPYHAGVQQQKGSGCFKVFLITSLVGLVALVACCITGGFYIKNSVITDPTELEQLSSDLIDWDFNNELTTVFGLDTFVFQMVFKADPDKGAIMMVQPGSFSGLKVGQRVDGAQQRELQFGGEAESEETVLIERGERTIEIGDHTIILEFNKTESVRTKRKFWEVCGVFPGKRGPVLALIQLQESAYSDKEIEERIRSIKVP
jgi:hypothetical protein